MTWQSTADMPRTLRRAVLLLSPWFFVQAFLVAVVFRRRRSAVLWGIYVVGSVVVAVVVGFFAPLVLLLLALVAGGATLVGMWAGRGSSGVDAGLPRGRLPLVNLPAVIDREHFVKQAERGDRIFKAISPVVPSPTVCVVGLPRAVAFLREHDEDLRPAGHPFDSFITGRLLRHMQGEAHRHYRKILRDAIDADVIERCRPEIEAIVGDAFEGLSHASLRNRRRGVAPADALERDFVIPLFLLLFFGMEPGSPDAERASALFLSMHQDMTGPPRGERYRAVETTTLELDRIILRRGAEIAAQRAAGVEPRPSFLSSLLRAHPGALEDPTVLRNLIFMLWTGTTDLSGLLHWLLKLLGDNSGWLAAVRDAANPDALADRIVMETLRLEQSELLHRYTTKEIDVDGVVIPAGWLVRVCVRESHRDPTVFEDPKRFDPDRFQRQFSRTEYSPLGTLAHTCLGSDLIKTVAGTFVRHLAVHYDLAVVSDGRPVFMIHWRPSRRHRVVLQPRTASGDPVASTSR